MVSFPGSNTAAIFVTCPTRTPLNSTGEPTDRARDRAGEEHHERESLLEEPAGPENHDGDRRQRNGADDESPDHRLPRLPSHGSSPPRGSRRPAPGILRSGQELLRAARGDHRLALAVEEHRVIGDGEDALELVRHHHDGGAEAVAQIRG